MIRRVIGIVALAAAATAVVPAAAQASAQGFACAAGYSCLTTYYSDATHTTVIGTRSVNCKGDIYTTGSGSQWITFDMTRCG